MDKKQNKFDAPTGENEAEHFNYNGFKKEAIEHSIQSRKLREKYANRAFNYLCVYTAAAIVIAILNGFKLWGFMLSNTVMVALLGSIPVSVIGLVLAVIKGLFPVSVK